MGAPTKEPIRIEAAFVGRALDVVEFDGCIVDHYIPPDRVTYGAGGEPQCSIIAGEYAIITDAPVNFDHRGGWNRITVVSLGGWRVVTGTSPVGRGQIRVDLKRLPIPNA